MFVGQFCLLCLFGLPATCGPQCARRQLRNVADLHFSVRTLMIVLGRHACMSDWRTAPGTWRTAYMRP